MTDVSTPDVRRKLIRDAAGQARRPVLVAGDVATSPLLGAMVLSVFKPWGRVRALQLRLDPREVRIRDASEPDELP